MILTKHKLKYSYHSASPKEIRLVEKSLSFFDEKARFVRAYQDGKWDGIVRYYNRHEKTFYFGLLDLVLKGLKEAGVSWSIQAKDVGSDVNFLDVKFDERLRDYQKEAVIEFIKSQHGIIKVPTRGGKTFIASEIIRILLEYNPEYRIMLVFDSQDLVRQTSKDISDFLQLPKKQIGILKGEKLEFKQITCAMIQTLQLAYNNKVQMYTRKKEVGKDGKTHWKRTPKPAQQVRAERAEKRGKKHVMNEYLASVDVLIVDECHEFTSEARVDVLKRIANVSYSLYLSATPFRKRDLFGNLNLQQVSCGIVYTITEEMLKGLGFLAQTKALLIVIDHEQNKNLPTGKTAHYADYYKQVIVRNNYRNNLIINVVEILRKMQLKTLVLFSIREHGIDVSKVTGDPFISGEQNTDDRDVAKKTFLRGKGRVLFASNIFKKGITLPEVQVMVNAAGGMEETTVTQKKGRVMGVTKTKSQALIIDFVDMLGTYFSKHSLARINQYQEELGEHNISVLQSEDPDFYVDLKEFIKGWFEID